jgi:ankyrin repeat protein
MQSFSNGKKARKPFSKNSLALMKDRIVEKLFKKTFNRRLLRAAGSGDVAGAMKALQKGADPNATAEKDYIVRPRDPNELPFHHVYDKGDSALILAAKKGNKEMIEALISAGADVNRQKEGGGSALMYAVSGKQRNVDICLLLIENGAEINATSNWSKETALMEAAHSGNIEACRLLIENGADVNMKDKNGETALMKAAEHFNIKICEILIENGADMDATDNKGRSALIHALLDLIEQVRFSILNEHMIKTSKMLVRKGADATDAIRLVGYMHEFSELRTFMVLERSLRRIAKMDYDVFRSNFEECVKQ